MSKSSFFNRSKKLMSMASNVAAKEAVLKLSSLITNVKTHEVTKGITRIKQAQAITQNLSQMKGAAMKAGQLLSIDSSQFLPPEALEILSQLQSQAEPEAFDIIESVLSSELKDRRAFLNPLDVNPIAAASIGQVHRAVYQGKDVVVKIQYPNIEESIDSDLEFLKKIVKLFLYSTNKKIDITSTFEELKFVLHLEADYERESKFLKKVYEKLQGNSFYCVPAPFFEMTTKKVLTMEFCEGCTLNDWIQSSPSVEDRNLVGKKILDLFILEFLDWRIVQTDPNFGNYLIQKKPLKIVLLDFGSSLEYSEEFIRGYLNVLSVAHLEAPNLIFDQAVKFDLLDSREDDIVKKNFAKLMTLSVEPFLSKEQPFNFSSLDYEKRSREAVLQFTKSLKYSPPPRKVLFLHRKLGGIFSLLRKLDVKLNLNLYWEILMNTRDQLESEVE